MSESESPGESVFLISADKFEKHWSVFGSNDPQVKYCRNDLLHILCCPSFSKLKMMY